MRRRSIVALAVALLPAVLAAQSPARPLEVPYRQFQLANGLNVILHRDTSVPVVAVNVWYHVGSANERPGRTGFAHLFEHLMFEGSKHVKEGEFDTLLEAAGGNNNGSTINDRTNYVHRRAVERAGAGALLESDRMAYLLDTMSPERVDGQRDVVKNERRQSYENRPYGMASIELDKMLWPAGHPYSWPTIGYMEDLTAASYDDVVQFFKKYYAPNNASLVIAGDIDFDRDAGAGGEVVRRGAEGRGRSSRSRRRRRCSPSVKRQTMTDRVRLSQLFLGWLTPARLRAGRRRARRGRRRCWRAARTRGSTSGWSTTRRWRRTSRPRSSRAARQLVHHRGHGAAGPHGGRDAEGDRRGAGRSCGRSRRTSARCSGRSIRSRRRSTAAWSASAASAARPTSSTRYFVAGGGPDYFAEDLARYTSLSPSDVQAAVGAVAAAGAARGADR